MQVAGYALAACRAYPVLTKGSVMKQLDDMVADFGSRFGNRWSLPEYRQIELYSKKKKLAFCDDEPPAQVKDTLSSGVAFMLLEGFLAARDPSLMEGKTSWQKYLALPRKTGVEKLVAEVYRLLRVYRIALFHPDGLVEAREGLIRTSCVFERCSLSLNITTAGLALLESFVFHYLDSFRQPYGEAYVEAMLMQYFTDIVGEVRKFADEDRVLYQFRQTLPFNRHFRFDCDNPKYELLDDHLVLDIGKIYGDRARYPIDFFLEVGNAVYILPVEALTGNRFPIAELGKWAARGTELPAHFRSRFGRETMVVGLPMT
jgi:hypothetical protein